MDAPSDAVLRDSPDDEVGLAADVLEQILRRRSPQGEILILPVLLPGSPFPSASEERIRTRYAVVSALLATGYTHTYPDRLTVARVKATPTAVANRDARPDIFSIPLKLLIRENSDEARHLPATVLILWINESVLARRPLDMISQFLHGLLRKTMNDPPNMLTSAMRLLWKTRPKSIRNLRVAILGPFSSDVLRDILLEDKEYGSRRPEDRPLHFLRQFDRLDEENIPHLLLSPRATVPLEHLGIAPGDPEIASLRSRPDLEVGLRLVHMIGTDAQLAVALSRELKLRSAWPRDFLGSANSDRHVVVVYEQDSLYGRQFTRILSDRLIPKKNLHLFGFRRGLDGRLVVADQEGARSDDLPEGPSQTDYLRRLAGEIVERNRFLRSSGQGAIGSVGVVGADIFDKLLIFRALRPHLPKAAFFTTDLDARLWHPSEYPFTRNIVVASHFGLGLNRARRLDAPPFRDSYQSSVFLSTLNALNSDVVQEVFTGHAREESAQSQKSAAARFDPWGRGPLADRGGAVLSPMLFEIARSGPWRLPTEEKETQTSKDLQAADVEEGAPAETLLLSLLTAALFIGVCAGASQKASNLFRSAYSWLYQLTPDLLKSIAALPPPSKECPEATGGPPMNRRRAVVTAFAFFLLFCVIVADHARVHGEPFSVTRGISVWPSAILLFISSAVSIFLIITVRARVRTWIIEAAGKAENEEAESEKATSKKATSKKATSKKATSKKATSKKATSRNEDGYDLSQQSHDFVKQVTGEISRELASYPNAEGGSAPSLEARAWRRRMLRVFTYFCFSGLLFFTTDTFPGIPCRGEVAWWTSVAANLLSLICLFSLTVYVIDVIVSCRKAIDGRLQDQTAWEGLRDAPEPGDGNPQRMAARYVRACASYTQEIGKLVYFPFGVVLFFSASRLSFFDNWDVPWTLYFVLVLLLAGVVVEVVRIRLSAARLRRYVVSGIRDCVESAIEKEGSSTSGVVAVQESRVARMLEERRGAFRPLLEDPIVIAASIPFGGTGSLFLLERIVGSG